MLMYKERKKQTNLFQEILVEKVKKKSETVGWVLHI